MDEFNGEVKELFAAYKQSVPDPEASANFMPGLWRRIEARQTSVVFLRRLTEGFVTAAVVTILVASFLIPRWQSSPVYTTTYVDVLASTQMNDSVAYADIYHAEPGAEAPTR